MLMSGVSESIVAQTVASTDDVTSTDDVASTADVVPTDDVTSTDDVAPTTQDEKQKNQQSQLDQQNLLLPDSVKAADFTLPAPIPLAGDHRPFLMYGITPFDHNGYANWDLHKGFNASFGMSVSVGFGKNRLHGVGFGQDAAFLYAVPLNERLSVAGGVYATNMDWGNYNYRNVGITGIAAFKATERITLYGYGNKSLMPRRMFPAYPLPNFSPDKLGGMVNFKVGESASFSIGVEAIKNNHPYGYYW